MRLSVSKRRSRLFACVCLMAMPILGSAQTYTVTDLGTLGGTETVAIAINASGQITGGSTTASGAYHAFLYFNGKMTDLGTLGGPSSQGQSINKLGTVAGYAQLPPGPLGGYPPHPISLYNAFTDANGKMTGIGATGGVGYAINDLDEVVAVEPTGAILYSSNGTATNLGGLGGSSGSTQPECINNSGQVVGYGYLPDGNFRGFVWANGAMTVLGTLGGDWSQAYAINTAGVVTGAAYTTGNLTQMAFVYSNGNMRSLGVLSANGLSVGRAINSANTVVGYATAASGSYHAFIYSGSKMQDLNNLIPANSGWVLSQANGINDSGEIVGYGIVNGLEHGFLLTPKK